MADSSSHPVLRYLRKITVEPTIFLYMFYLFLQLPTFQALIYYKVCTFKYNDTTICDNLENETYKQEEMYVQKESSSWILKTNLAFGLPSILVVTFFLAPWGDRVGRKVPVILPVVGSILNSCFNLLNALFIDWELQMLVIGPLLNGLSGGFVACMMSGYSYVGHDSDKEFKTIRVGIIEALIFLAGTFGVLLSGVLLDRTSFTFVFSVTIGITSLALVYTLVFVRDLKPDERATSTSLVKTICHEHVKQPWMCIIKERPDRTKLYIGLQLFVKTLMIFCTAGEFDLLFLFTKLPIFDWPLSLYGYFKALENFLRGFAVLAFVPVLKRRFKIRDTTLGIIGLISKVFASVVLGLASETWHIFVVAVIGILQGFTSAALSSIMSSMVEKNEQGKLFGLIATMESIAILFATLVFNNLYPVTLSFFRGFCFLISAGLLVIAFIVMIYLHRSFEGRESLSYSKMTNDTSTESEAINSGSSTEEEQNITIEEEDNRVI